MADKTTLTKRRFLTIAAATTSAALFPAAFAGAGETTAWQGTALGADVKLLFHGLRPAQQERLIGLALAEIERLESIFSLYNPRSELCRLNRDGVLKNPSHEMQVLLSQALFFWRETGGAFNPAIQPVWRAIADHFKDEREGHAPNAERIRNALSISDPAKIRNKEGRIVIQPGMALTFNGIAQGYITDCVARILNGQGMRRVLIDLGELRALPGKSWNVGIAGANMQMRLKDQALATSAPSGTLLSPDGDWHHLIDPETGTSADYIRQVSVLADDATTADALSTALAVSATDKWEVIAKRFADVSIHIETAAGKYFSTGRWV